MGPMEGTADYSEKPNGPVLATRLPPLPATRTREMRRVLLWGPAGAPAPELSPQLPASRRPAAGPQGRDQDEIDILSEVAEAAGAEPVFG